MERGEYMSAKDITEKTLESYNDVFADIVNVLLFDGKKVISPDDLEDKTTLSSYKADEKLKTQERDVAKLWKKGTIRLACIGVENQTQIDSYMPLRVISYDGAEYRMQYDSVEAKYPVFTFILYFGDKKWKDEISLKDCLNIPEELKDLVNDYKVKVFSISHLSSETVEKFTSDFKIVADYFVQQRTTKEYVPSPQIIAHVRETLELLSVMGGDERFITVYNENQQEKEGGYTMSSIALDNMIAKEQKRIAINLNNQGLSLAQIAAAINCQIDVVKKWIDSSAV